MGRGKYYFNFSPQSWIYVFDLFFICFVSLYIKVEESIDRTCSVLSQYDKKFKGIPVYVDTIRQKCQFKIVVEK
jgi:hypothetical protein